MVSITFLASVLSLDWVSLEDDDNTMSTVLIFPFLIDDVATFPFLSLEIFLMVSMIFSASILSLDLVPLEDDGNTSSTVLIFPFLIGDSSEICSSIGSVVTLPLFVLGGDGSEICSSIDGIDG